MLTKLTAYSRTCAPEDVAAMQKKNLENYFSFYWRQKVIDTNGKDLD